MEFQNTFPVTFEFYQFLGHYTFFFLGKLFASADLWAPTESEIPRRLLWPPWQRLGLSPCCSSSLAFLQL